MEKVVMSIRRCGIRRKLAVALGALGLLCALCAFKSPSLTGRIVDRTGLFTPRERANLDRMIRAFEQATGGQLFVAVLPPFDDASLEEAGITLMNEWKPGDRGKDNGAILLIVPARRKMRLEIGYGWEGKVNDAKAGDIIRMMGGYFRDGRYYHGVAAAIDRLAADISGHGIDGVPAGARRPPRSEVNEKIRGIKAIVILIFLVIIFIKFPWLIFFVGGGGGGGRGGWGGGGFGGGGFGGGRGGGGGGGGASGGW